MLPKHLNLQILSDNTDFQLFNCGDDDLNSQKHQLGRLILDYVKSLTLNQQLAGCRFITVDAYRTAFTFYEKNGFEYLTQKDVNDHTRLMYYDLCRLL